MSLTDNHINYVEFKTNDIASTKAFYSQLFNWTFTDYGPTYTAFADSGLMGGFELSDEKIVNGALIVLYHSKLESVRDEVIEAGGQISKEIFSFPGGRRFHFKDPAGNELAIWSELE